MIFHNTAFPCFRGIKCNQCAACDNTELTGIEKSICVICAQKDKCEYDRKEDTIACFCFKREEENHAGQE